MTDIAIFAVTNRTGSTLLQRIFNANPDTLIWGENGRALTRLLGMQTNAIKFSRAMAKRREIYFANNRPMDLDISCMSPDENCVNESSIKATQAFFESMYPKESGKRIGFKEVSHRPMAVDLFRHAFPKAECVFLARHPISAWRSHPENFPVSVEEFIENWCANVEGYAQRGKLFWFEDLVADSEVQEQICELAQISDEALRSVLSVKVNSTSAKSMRPDSDFERITAACHSLIPDNVEESFLARAG